MRNLNPGRILSKITVQLSKISSRISKAIVRMGREISQFVLKIVNIIRSTIVGLLHQFIKLYNNIEGGILTLFFHLLYWIVLLRYIFAVLLGIPIFSWVIMKAGYISWEIYIYLNIGNVFVLALVVWLAFFSKNTETEEEEDRRILTENEDWEKKFIRCLRWPFRIILSLASSSLLIILLVNDSSTNFSALLDKISKYVGVEENIEISNNSVTAPSPTRERAEKKVRENSAPQDIQVLVIKTEKENETRSQSSGAKDPFNVIDPNEISKFQNFLRNRGYDRVQPDGVAGDITKEALLSWAIQSSSGSNQITIDSAISMLRIEIEKNGKVEDNAVVPNKNIAGNDSDLSSLTIIDRKDSPSPRVDYNSDFDGRYLDGKNCLRNGDGSYVLGFRNNCK